MGTTTVSSYILQLAPHIFSACKKNEFQCPSSGRCLQPNHMCDNTTDCGDGFDEQNCTSELHACTLAVQ